MNQDLNPFTKKPTGLTGMQQVESDRAAQEVMMAMTAAKRFPRDERVSMDRILKACTRTQLAEQAEYEYTRGGTEIKAPSIRLAEAIAQQWGNISFGIQELEQTTGEEGGESTVMAFAWDLETNTRQVKVFQVPHIRYRRPERGGPIALEDPRDIYELVANNGARRLRACILGVIPGDVVDAAARQCRVTLEAEACTPEQVEQVVQKFSELDITADLIARRLNHPLKDMTTAELISLRRVYVAIRDGFANASEMFEGFGKGEEGGVEEADEDLRRKVLEQRKKAAQEKEARAKQAKAEQDRKDAAAKQAAAVKAAEEEKKAKEAKKASKEARQGGAEATEQQEAPVPRETAPDSPDKAPAHPKGSGPIVMAKDIEGCPEELWEFIVEKQGPKGWPKRLSDGLWYDIRWIGIKGDTQEECAEVGVGWGKNGMPAIVHSTSKFAAQRRRKEEPAPKANKTDTTPAGGYSAEGDWDA